MTLYDLTQGEKGIITKVRGHGSFRKRIIEMGFVIGKEVEVVKKAPLRDPVEYKILDYFVSLRNNEARLIEVSREAPENGNGNTFQGTLTDNSLKTIAKKSGEKEINIALVGNPTPEKQPSSTISAVYRNAWETIAA